LRRRYAMASDDAVGLRETLVDVARPLAIELLAMLYDEERPVPDSDQTSAVYTAAARAFGLDGDALASLAALRAASANDGSRNDVLVLFGQLLAMLASLSDRADAKAGATQ